MTTVRQPMRRPTRLNWLPVGVDEVHVPGSLRLGWLDEVPSPAIAQLRTGDRYKPDAKLGRVGFMVAYARTI